MRPGPSGKWRRRSAGEGEGNATRRAATSFFSAATSERDFCLGESGLARLGDVGISMERVRGEVGVAGAFGELGAMGEVGGAETFGDDGAMGSSTGATGSSAAVDSLGASSIVAVSIFFVSSSFGTIFTSSTVSSFSTAGVASFGVSSASLRVTSETAESTTGL